MLVLADANHTREAPDDGFLTAEEMLDLDLAGTELVVLSACESGVGEVVNGEGVFGMRRALALAGARPQVISLWKVSDPGTAKLMQLFYAELSRGSDPTSALTMAQRKLRKQHRLSAPYFLAGSSCPEMHGPSHSAAKSFVNATPSAAASRFVVYSLIGPG
jgi:CHAT domain-containing protein